MTPTTWSIKNVCRWLSIIVYRTILSIVTPNRYQCLYMCVDSHTKACTCFVYWAGYFIVHARALDPAYIARYVVKVRIDFGDGLHHGIHVPMMHRHFFLRSLRVHFHIGYVTTHQDHIDPGQRNKQVCRCQHQHNTASRLPARTDAARQSETAQYLWLWFFSHSFSCLILSLATWMSDTWTVHPESRI